PSGGWGRYIFWENLKHAERVLDARPLWSATHTLRRSTREFYEREREEFNNARRVQLKAWRSGLPMIQDAPSLAPQFGGEAPDSLTAADLHALLVGSQSSP